MSGLVHALSVDVEDWNNAAVLWVAGRIVPPTDDVVRNTERMLGLFEEHGVKATWFVLGEVAETFPGLVRRLAEGGHELGVHGYHHHRLHELGPTRFRESILRAKATVEGVSGTRTRGYRAVAMSLTRATWWAYDTLFEVGGEYGEFDTTCSHCLMVGDVSGDLTITCIQGGRRLARRCHVADDYFSDPCPPNG